MVAGPAGTSACRSCAKAQTEKASSERALAKNRCFISASGLTDKLGLFGSNLVADAPKTAFDERWWRAQVVEWIGGPCWDRTSDHWIKRSVGGRAQVTVASRHYVCS